MTAKKTGALGRIAREVRLIESARRSGPCIICYVMENQHVVGADPKKEMSVADQRVVSAEVGAGFTLAFVELHGTKRTREMLCDEHKFELVEDVVGFARRFVDVALKREGK